MIRFLFCVLLVVNSAAVADERPDVPFNPLNLLFDTHVRRELELLPDQTEQILDMRARMLATPEYQELRNDRSISDHERMQKITEMMAENLQKVSDRVYTEVLVPHQVDRLKQCAWQQSAAYDLLATMKTARVLDNATLPEAEKIYEKRERELAKLVDRHRKETENMVLREVMPSQRKRWQELLGEPAKIAKGLPTRLPHMP